MPMNAAIDFKFDDLQALLRFGHGKLTDTCFMLLNIADAAAAGQWLGTAPISSAAAKSPPPDTALQVAFSVEGLRALGLKQPIIEGFSDEFISGMAGDKSRSRRLGDVGRNAPQHWEWGGEPGRVPHVLLLLYAGKEGVDAWRNTVTGPLFSKAFQLLQILPTQDIGGIEPFGFADGISQPEIDWTQWKGTDTHHPDRFSNQVAPGEFVLGYPNEYGQYTIRPRIDPQEDRLASLLPDAQEQSSLKDFGRNGSYLVIRQLHQDVVGFWQFIDEAAGSDPAKREQLAASMVGRHRNGSPLAPLADKPIPGIPRESRDNHFTYERDPNGHQCPLGAHIRRANPRTGDLPPGGKNLFARLLKMLGFRQNRPDEDLVASTRFHRMLRRGRSYGPVLAPEEAVKPDAPASEHGLQFIALVANIARQFEFIQNAWSMSSTFGGVQQERDPLFGVREPLRQGEPTDNFNRQDPHGPMHKYCGLPQFVTMRGGGYFFMPGLRALQFIAASSGTEGDNTP
jgi:deferrochelatase/peroxidase EfeB